MLSEAHPKQAHCTRTSITSCAASRDPRRRTDGYGDAVRPAVQASMTTRPTGLKMIPRLQGTDLGDHPGDGDRLTRTCQSLAHSVRRQPGRPAGGSPLSEPKRAGNDGGRCATEPPQTTNQREPEGQRRTHDDRVATPFAGYRRFAEVTA